MSFQACFWFVYLWNFRNLWWQPSFQVGVVAICSGNTLVTCIFTPFSPLGFQLLFSDISPLKSRMRFPYCCLERRGERKLVGNVQVLLVVVPFILALLQKLLSPFLHDTADTQPLALHMTLQTRPALCMSLQTPKLLVTASINHLTLVS